MRTIIFALFAFILGGTLSAYFTWRVVSDDVDASCRTAFERHRDNDASMMGYWLELAQDGKISVLIARNCLLLQQRLGDPRSRLDPALRARYAKDVESALAAGQCSGPAAE